MANQLLHFYALLRNHVQYLFDVEDGGELVVPDGRHALHRGEEVGGAERLGVVGERQGLQPLLHAQRGKLLFAQLWNGKNSFQLSAVVLARAQSVTA